jgi:hypothetical protein
MLRLAVAQTYVGQEDGAGDAEEGEADNRRQRKLGKAEASSAVMFGSDRHIVFSQSSSVLERGFGAFEKARFVPL